MQLMAPLNPFNVQETSPAMWKIIPHMNLSRQKNPSYLGVCHLSMTCTSYSLTNRAVHNSDNASGCYELCTVQHAHCTAQKYSNGDSEAYGSDMYKALQLHALDTQEAKTDCCKYTRKQEKSTER